MRKLIFIFLLCIMLISFSSAVSIVKPAYTEHNFTKTASVLSGWEIVPSRNISLSYVNVMSTNDKVYIRNASNDVLGTFAVTNHNATITGINLTAGQKYEILANGTTQTSYYDGLTFPLTFTDLSINRTRDNSGALAGGTELYEIREIGFNRLDGANSNSDIYNSTTYESARESFISNVSVVAGKTISSVVLYHNNTAYSSVTVSTSGSNYILSKTIDIGNIVGNSNWFWSLYYSDSSQENMSVNTQTISPITLTLCNSTINTPYLNFTFKNETLLLPYTTGSISSSFEYWISNQAYAKTYTFANATENPSYAFCFSPSNQPIKATPTLVYYSAAAVQRGYTPGTLTLTNSTTNNILYMLPTDSGIYVSFQVTNAAEQLIEGASVNISTASIGLVEARTTDSSGIATFFLNPLTSYTICGSKAEYGTNCFSLTPTQSQYTINLGGTSNAVNITNYNRGISYTLLPTPVELTNNTNYHFNFSISSSYYVLSGFGLVISNSSGAVLGSVTSSSSSGIVDTIINTGSNSALTANAYWLVDGNYTNITRTYVVYNTADSGWSIANFFNRLSTYINDDTDSDGLYGLKNTSDGKSFGLYLIIFLIIFGATGLMSYKFGLTSPIAIVTILFGLTFFFDTMGLLPRPNDTPFFITAMVFLIMIGIFIREGVNG